MKIQLSKNCTSEYSYKFYNSCHS